MIFTESRQGRRFVGEVPPGQPLMATLAQWTENFHIDSGWVEGTGLVRDALLRRVQDHGQWGDLEVFAGPSQLVQFKLAISQRPGQDEPRDLSARVLLALPDGQLVAGLLHECVSASVELLAVTFDDITLRRVLDDDSGLYRWLDVGVNQVAAEASAGRSARVAMEALPSRLLEAEEMPQLRVGDAIVHPTLGQCVIVQVFDNDRVGIEITGGKVAQLHLGVLSLSRLGVRSGRMVYEAKVRRRGI
jgi:predicted DNA-binding protein with PD1-like motif